MTKIEQKIPDGWSVKKLGEIGTFVSGGTPDTEKAEYWNGDIVWLTPSEITKLKTRFVSDSERKITKLGLKNSSAVLLPKNSLIICTRATIGDCCINTKEVSTNQGFKNLIPNNNCTDFFYYLISIHKSDLIRRACGSTFLEISKHDIEKLKYVFPPLAEQEKIAEILSCWDEGIEKLSALIEKKKIQKKALMQQILTGKHRLKGFSTPWYEVKLGDIGSFYNGYAFKSNSYRDEGKYKIITIANVQQGCMDLSTANKIVELPEDIQEYQILNKNDIIFSMTGNVGRVCFVKERDCLLNQRVGKIVATKVQSVFLYYLINTEKFIKNMISLSQGGAQDNLSMKDIKNYRVFIPSDLAEQKAIADILSKADEEIELLNKKLEAFKLEKKALMQKLLTGKIRVKVN